MRFYFQVGGFGLEEAIGDLDFYPNGGLHQPGCDGGVRWISDARFRFCSHGRAVDYFIESVVRKKAFPSVVCDNYAKFKVCTMIRCANAPLYIQLCLLVGPLVTLALDNSPGIVPIGLLGLVLSDYHHLFIFERYNCFE